MSDDPNIWREIFSPLAQATAFFGGLGGLVHGLALKRTWRETFRITLIGGLSAFGFGVMSFQILQMWFPQLPDGAASGLGVMSSGAFFMGIVAVFLIEKLIDRFSSQEADDGNS